MEPSCPCPLRNTCCVPTRRNKQKQTQELVHKSFNANWGLGIFPDLWLSMRLKKNKASKIMKTQKSKVCTIFVNLFCHKAFWNIWTLTALQSISKQTTNLANIHKFQPSNLVNDPYILLQSWEIRQVNAILYNCKGTCYIITPNLTKYCYLFCSFYWERECCHSCCGISVTFALKPLQCSKNNIISIKKTSGIFTVNKPT